jgi:hypothetical protein
VIGPESIIYCQKIGDLRYDLPPEPTFVPDDVAIAVLESASPETEEELI